MKRYFLFTIMSVLLISCQQNLTPEYPSPASTADEVMTRSLSAGKVTPDDPVVFLSEDETNFWSQTVSLEERFKAFEVPASRLSTMTTEALVKSMMNYPLNYLVLIKSDPKDALDLIIENSSLHQEFLSRSDAAEVFVNMYASIELDMRVEKSNYDGDYICLSLANTMFMENMLCSGKLIGLGKSTVKQKLAEAVAENLQHRINNNDIFDWFSIQPLLEIDEVASLGVCSVMYAETREPTPYFFVFTILGKRIKALSMTEMTSTSMSIITNNMVSSYPDAILRGAPSNLYNGNTYAWHSRSTAANGWIDGYDNGEFQLEKYWTNDLYIECSEEDAEIVYFPDDDHSAVKLSNGKYISKWDHGPLMEHDLEDCPFECTNPRYFKMRETPIPGALTINGTTPVTINQSYNYSINERYNSLTYSWEVRFMDAPTPTPFILNVNSTGRGCSLTCQDYGLFKTIVYGYYQGRPVAMGQLDVIALP